MTKHLDNRLVSLIGGGGFVGKYAAQALLSGGARVRVIERNPAKAMAIKPLGGLGQTQFVAADITNYDSLARAVRGSDAIVNLVGILKGNFARMHCTGAENAARAAQETGAASFVHISAIGADPGSDSGYARSKGRGEELVRERFSDAVILRPSIVFGPEDNFINRFARLIGMAPVVPLIGAETRFQPVYAGDVGTAIAAVIADPARHAGKTYELGGPDVLSMAELNRHIARETGKSRGFLAIPGFASKLLAKLTGWAPGAPITSDQWRMLQRDNVVGEDAHGFAALDIAPTPLAAVTPGWLVRYRRQGRFAPRTQR